MVFIGVYYQIFHILKYGVLHIIHLVYTYCPRPQMVPFGLFLYVYYLLYFHNLFDIMVWVSSYIYYSIA